LLGDTVCVCRGTHRFSHVFRHYPWLHESVALAAAAPPAKRGFINLLCRPGREQRRADVWWCGACLLCSNPMAGTDTTLLALSGTGYMNGRSFGFASCERTVGAAEGVNVLVERRVRVPVEPGGRRRA
jgi:hypothetical protein